MTTQAGASSLERFRRERRANFKQDWKLWLGLFAFAGVAFAVVGQFGTVGLIAGAWILGFVSALAVFGWMIGFDAHSLTWLWGSWGEADTAEELKRLGPEWHLAHDVENASGNWDHVVVGPGGVFMIDTKRLRGQVMVKEDGLSSGRLRYRGVSFRNSAVRLREALQQHIPVPWVQAVVTVWGEFPAGAREEDRVVYIRADELVSWLSDRTRSLDQNRARSIAGAVELIRPR